MARLDDLIPFAQRHNLKIGTIRDLIAYRRRHDHLIERRTEADFTSRWGGDWKAITFNSATQSEQARAAKGILTPTSRPQSVCISSARLPMFWRGKPARRYSCPLDGDHW